MARTDTNLGVRCPPELFARLETTVGERKTTRTAFVMALIEEAVSGTPGGSVLPKELASARGVIDDSLRSGRDPVRDVICAAAVGGWKSPLAELLRRAFAGLDYQALVDAKVKELALECRPARDDTAVRFPGGNPLDDLTRIRFSTGEPPTPELPKAD
jgi:hypothetical protein